jgi:DNA-binding ferritin-like protein (Dps family)
MKKITDETLDKNELIDLLPHGSGINRKWTIQVLKNGKILASNYYEAMNECGMYCHTYDFTAKISYSEQTGYYLEKINFHGQKEYSCCGYDLKSYLDELIYTSVRDYSELDQNKVK